LDYDVEHAGDHLLILHNDGGAENFEIATAALTDPGTWTPLVPQPRRHPAARGSMRSPTTPWCTSAATA